MSYWLGLATASLAVLPLATGSRFPVERGAARPPTISEALAAVRAEGLMSDPTAVSWGSGRIDVFARGADNALWHKWYDGQWSGWESLGGTLASGPDVASWGSGRLDVFALGPNRDLVHKSYQGSWSAWASLGGVLTSDPSAVAWGPGRLDVFARGGDNALWHIWFTGGSWSGWENLGGTLGSGPDAASWGVGRLDVFAVGTDKTLQHKCYCGQWSGWTSLGGGLTSDPSAVAWGTNRLDIFARGGDNALWHIWFSGSWSGWESLGGALGSGPDVSSWGSGRLDVFALGTDKALYHKWYAGAWSAWTGQGTPATALAVAPSIGTSTLTNSLGTSGTTLIGSSPPPPPAPPPPGPPPQGLTFVSGATYGIFAKLAWNPAPNAVNYVVTRSKRDDASCCNATSGPLPANVTSWGDAGLYKAGYYRYTVTVRYADGSVGANAVDMLLQQSASPAPVTIQDLSPGRVRIQWNLGVPGACCVKIVGPGFGTATEKLVVGGGPVDLFLPATGTYSWKLATGYDQKNIPFPVATNYGSWNMYGTTYVVLSPPSEWADASHTVTIRSGRYRISLERFQAQGDIPEDLLRSDGRGNEVYIATQVSEYGRNGALKATRMVRTPTFGDVQNYPARVRAGSMSTTGGIRKGDEYPAAVQYISQLVPPSVTNLPYFLWEGELSELEGAVILSPSIWEADEDERLFPQFLTFQLGAAPDWPYRNYLQGYVPSTLSTSVADTWRPTTGNNCKLADLFKPFGAWGDQPVDMSSTSPYCPKYVAINWRIADGATRVNPATVLEFPFYTGYGQYTLFIRIEKVPSTAVIGR